MSTMSNDTNMSFRVDKNSKKQVDELFKNLGMNTSVAHEPSAELKEAL